MGHSVDVIFTFDVRGVSGHPNHCSLHDALQLAINQNLDAFSSVDIFALRSANIVRKYSGWLEPLIWMIALVPLEWNVGGSSIVVLSTPMKCWEGMTHHKSQFVWFRKLFVLFSRYAWVNEFDRMRPQETDCKKRN